MNANATRRGSTILNVLESVLHLASIPLSLSLFMQTVTLFTHELDLELSKQAMDAVEAVFNPAQGIVLTVLLFAVLAAIRGIRAVRARGEGKGPFAVALLQTALFLVCAVLPVVMGFTGESLRVISVLYAIAMIAGRILSIVQNHRLGNVLWNTVCILILAASVISFMMTITVIFFLTVLSMMKIIFSRIRVATLLAIIRKTYAAEILFGLLLLISTFSILLFYFEPGMGDIRDAFWYCFAIVTTIGFGDLTAVTDFGRILSVILGAYGIVVVALITSIIVNYYGEMKREDGAPEADKAQGGDAQAESHEQA